ncbi:kinesin motor domain containing protein [Nitzschia inconspicua]|uniref:Kinesin-like protein n=1 Tax=Nitzschia inconspicua TaxID=303405 RepID=A0A9K3L1N0_9STRA|nr:kinesin motor domain containing protein [Nitzschia inconspicua]
MKRVFRSAKKADSSNNNDSVFPDSIPKSSLVSTSNPSKSDINSVNAPPHSGSTMSISSRSTASGVDPCESARNTPTSAKQFQPTRLQTNVQVCARIRPVLVSESKETDSFFKIPKRRTFLPIPSSRKSLTGITQSNNHSKRCPDETLVAWDVSGGSTTASQAIQIQKIQGRTHSYTLDKVFDSSITTQQIYNESVHPLVQAAMEGYHSTVLAYGQTSTGKTYTMTGTKESPGLIALCIKDCFRFVQQNEEPREYLFRLSYLEVYKEHIRDLLNSKTPPEPVRLFDGPNGLIIRGMKEEVVTSAQQVFQLLQQGEQRRQVGATHMNQHSSRSHVMVRLWIESSGGDQDDNTRISSLSLVDLAGSESVRLNGAERREEGHYINKSLMTLGQVVLSLSDLSSNNGVNKNGKEQHIPYRDSKLTRLLQPSLSGNAQMLLLCCISPLASHLEESHNTFKFATRAKRIEQKATIQTVQDKDETLLQTYRDEIEDLKQQLAEAKEQKRQLLELQSVSSTAKILSSTTSTLGALNYGEMETATEEIQELVEAIQNMEKLILKSRPHPSLEETLPVSSMLDVTLESLLQSDDEGTDDDEEMLVDEHIGRVKSDVAICVKSSTSSRSPAGDSEDELHSELSRIRGLLGSVLQRRGVVASQMASPEKEEIRKNLVFATPPRLPQTPDRSLSEELDAAMPFDEPIESEEKKAEVETLRKQLEEYERATTMCKADSSFLQKQLQEKDKLLEEVSNLLEAVEQRQAQLENENALLKQEVDSLKKRRSGTSINRS